MNNPIEHRFTKLLYSKGVSVNQETFGTIIPFTNLLNSVKRDLLLFDKIIFPQLFVYLDLEHYKKGRYEDYLKVQDIYAHFKYLESQRVIEDYSLSKSGVNNLWDKLKLELDKIQESDLKFEIQTSLSIGASMAGGIKDIYEYYKANPNTSDIENMRIMIAGLTNSADALFTHAISKIYRNNGFQILDSTILEKRISFNVIDSSNENKFDRDVNKEIVYSLIINNLPIPASTVPFNAIFDFRSEDENMRRMLKLRVWVNKILKEGNSANELSDEFESFLMDFTSAMKAAKIERREGGMKIFVTVVGFFNDLFIDRTKTLSTLLQLFGASLDVRKEERELLKTESAADGRDLAYIYFAKEKFK